MCGRFSVNKAISPIVSELFNTHFNTETNANLSPSQSVATLVSGNSTYPQVNALWGIKPSWSKRLIINAQSETVATKPTFRQAFQHQRCLIPCNGWFEWRTEEGKKVKYLFEHADKVPLYMGGILFQHEFTELVTLTTKPNLKCGQYHKRMPVLIAHVDKESWFQSSPQDLEPLLQHVNNEMIQVERSN
ncbi:MAG: putative SOS response-associated peptidase YedK [Alteromonadaceae bacterium]|jgi:putative SOS response-associated peptidase YedK